MLELAGDRQFTDPQTGEMFTGAAARANERLYNIAAQAISDNFIQENGFNELSMEFLAPALENIRKTTTKDASEAGKNEVKAQKGQTQLSLSNTLFQTSDPVTAAAEVASSKPAFCGHLTMIMVRLVY